MTSSAGLGGEPAAILADIAPRIWPLPDSSFVGSARSAGPGHDSRSSYSSRSKLSQLLRSRVSDTRGFRSLQRALSVA